MSLSALVTIDLPSANSKSRDLFYESLKNSQWKKDGTVTTAWRVNYKSTTTFDGILDDLKKDLVGAKSISGVSSYTAVIAIGAPAVNIQG